MLGRSNIEGYAVFSSVPGDSNTCSITHPSSNGYPYSGPRTNLNSMSFPTRGMCRLCRPWSMCVVLSILFTTP